jgi:tRNA pseudouridine38-40 synthase
MRTLKLTLSYDGGAYVGWQRQTNGPSVQSCLELALAPFNAESVTVVGAGRTDAGVHALAQVASVRLSHPIAPASLLRAANARLPADVRVLAADVVPDDFHARFSATDKTYRYRLLGGAITSPFERRYGWHVPARLDYALMATAGRLLVGEHDFAAFQASGGDVRTSTRTLFELDVCPPAAPEAFMRRRPAESASRYLARSTSPGGAWLTGDGSGETVATIDVRGSGFLRHMVRIIVGTLVEVGLGKRDHASVADAIRLAVRPAAGQTAPPHGLFLVRVGYAHHRAETGPLDATSST